MKQITLTPENMSAIIAAIQVPHGRAVVLPVRVAWPELQLTEEQMLANAAWAAQPHRAAPRPYPDPALIELVFPVVPI